LDRHAEQALCGFAVRTVYFDIPSLVRTAHTLPLHIVLSRRYSICTSHCSSPGYSVIWHTKSTYLVSKTESAGGLRYRRPNRTQGPLLPPQFDQWPATASYLSVLDPAGRQRYIRHQTYVLLAWDHHRHCCRTVLRTGALAPKCPLCQPDEHDPPANDVQLRVLHTPTHLLRT
jgi:hypothetical protein